KAQETMDEAEAIIRPMVESLPGYEGRMDLATMDGQFLSITLFDTADSAAAARRALPELGRQSRLRRGVPGGVGRPEVGSPRARLRLPTRFATMPRSA